MLIQQGQATWYGDRDEVRDTMTCNHCNTVVFVAKRGEDPNTAFCTTCMDHICLPCSSRGCTTWLQKMELAEEREQSRRSLGI